MKNIAVILFLLLAIIDTYAEIKIRSPKAGQSWMMGMSYTVRWDTDSGVECDSIYLELWHDNSRLKNLGKTKIEKGGLNVSKNVIKEFMSSDEYWVKMLCRKTEKEIARSSNFKIVNSRKTIQFNKKGENSDEIFASIPIDWKPSEDLLNSFLNEQLPLTQVNLLNLSIYPDTRNDSNIIAYSSKKAPHAPIYSLTRIANWFLINFGSLLKEKGIPFSRTLASVPVRLRLLKYNVIEADEFVGTLEFSCEVVDGQNEIVWQKTYSNESTTWGQTLKIDNYHQCLSDLVIKAAMSLVSDKEFLNTIQNSPLYSTNITSDTISHITSVDTTAVLRPEPESNLLTTQFPEEKAVKPQGNVKKLEDKYKGMIGTGFVLMAVGAPFLFIKFESTEQHGYVTVKKTVRLIGPAIAAIVGGIIITSLGAKKLREVRARNPFGFNCTVSKQEIAMNVNVRF